MRPDPNISCVNSVSLRALSLNLTFDVPVYDHVAVQIGHALQDLSCVLPGHVFCQRPVGLQLVLD